MSLVPNAQVLVNNYLQAPKLASHIPLTHIYKKAQIRNIAKQELIFMRLRCSIQISSCMHHAYVAYQVNQYAHMHGPPVLRLQMKEE